MGWLDQGSYTYTYRLYIHFDRLIMKEITYKIWVKSVLLTYSNIYIFLKKL